MRDKRTAHVYFLRCPSTGEVRYVGVTKHPVMRFFQHVNGQCLATRDWVASLDGNPEIDVVLSGLTRKQAERVEARLQMFHKVFNPGMLPMNARHWCTSHNGSRDPYVNAPDRMRIANPPPITED